MLMETDDYSIICLQLDKITLQTDNKKNNNNDNNNNSRDDPR